MTESQLQGKIIRWLLDHNCYVVRTVSTSRNGVPDLIVCIRGQFVAIEVKTDTNKPSPLQLINIDKIIQAGGNAYIVKGNQGWSELQETLKTKFAI